MEHRWGERFPVALAVRLSYVAPPALLGIPSAVLRLHSGATTILESRLTNASVSGALLNTDVRLPVFCHVVLEFEVARRSGVTRQRVPAYVVRHAPDGLGVEWQEFAPRPIVNLLERTLRGGKHTVLTHVRDVAQPLSR
jgi:hypothetical protein